MPDDNSTTPPIVTNDSAFLPPDDPSDPSLPSVVPPVSDDATTPVEPPSDPTPASVPAAPAAPVEPPVADPAPEPAEMPSDDLDILKNVAGKIAEAQNILVALSGDPSVDELSAAIGLSIYLDKLGKRATAIYSGTTPNALEFLNPEETLEPTADALQDFVIALNKDKADHLRYKLDGDYVKIYITPYRARIAEEDLEFSYGDFNVDLVLALDVANGIDLDAALREHGRIMHDAVIINITTGNPGKFGEIEWSDKKASSVSEMIAKLLYSINSNVPVEKEEATAFLTGIVAATNRFSASNTTPSTMQLASRLMESGANQQLISKNITPDVENEMIGFNMAPSSKKEDDPTKLDIEHEEESAEGEPKESRETKDSKDNDKEVDADINEKESTLLADLKAAEASLSQAGAETTPDLSNRPVRIDNEPNLPEEPASSETPVEAPTEIPAELESPLESPLEPASSPSLEPSEVPAPSFIAGEPAPSTTDGIATPEKVIAPTSDFASTPIDEGSDKYGKMLEDALAGIGANGEAPSTEPGAIISNPAEASAPEVPSSPELNGVPDISYVPMPEEPVLPPPPAPPLGGIDSSSDNLSFGTPSFDSATLPPVTPTSDPAGPTSLGSQPAMQDQVYSPQLNDPGAFKIPGM